MGVIINPPATQTVTVTPPESPSVVITPAMTQEIEVATEVAGDTVVTPPASQSVNVVAGIGVPGLDGTNGMDGAPGAPGRDGSDVASFTYYQDAPAYEWLIMHNLGRRVDISLYDTAGTRYPAFVAEYVDENTIRLTFSLPLNGYAYLI
jgi:hypothetical protein